MEVKTNISATIKAVPVYSENLDYWTAFVLLGGNKFYQATGILERKEEYVERIVKQYQNIKDYQVRRFELPVFENTTNV